MTARRIGWLTIDALVAGVVFAARVGRWTLNPLNAPRLIVEQDPIVDWATYIVGPNYLRTAPILSFPLGSVPDHIAPTGTSLAATDSSPLLTPLYRVANAIWPDRPWQLLGWIVLVAYVLVMVSTTAFVTAGVRALRRRAELAWSDHLAIRCVGAAALFMPFFSDRIRHVTLMQQWLVVVALYLAIFRRAPSRHTSVMVVGTIVLATAIQPYFLPMIGLVSLPYVVRTLRADRTHGIVAVLSTGVGVGAAALGLGYIAPGSSGRNVGFGAYSADLRFLVASQDRSRLVAGMEVYPLTFEGSGWIGAGMLGLVVAACALVLATGQLDRRVLRAVLPAAAAALVLVVLAALPNIRFGGRELLHLEGTPFAFSVFGEVFRTNGRLVWACAWLVVLAAACVVIAVPRRAIVGLVVAAMLVQFWDSPRMVVPSAPTATYESAERILDGWRREGISEVQIQPPWINYSCDLMVPYQELMTVVLASAVLRLPSNSGYPGRPSADFAQQCVAQAEAFRGDGLRADVAYVVNATDPMTAELDCRPINDVVSACRVAPVEPSA